MRIAVTDKDFIDKRRKIARFGPFVLMACLLIIAGFGAWAYFFQPLLANPFEVARLIEGGQLDDTSILLMAVMLPIVMLVCIMLTAAIVGVSWAGLSAEKRYLRIIDSLTSKA